MSNLVAQATTILRANGGRMTVQRRLILETLEALGGHPTAEQVYVAALEQDASLSFSTVYRTLSWLADAGLVSARRLQTGRDDRCEHFEVSVPVEHYHFICTECGQVTEFESPYIEKIKAQFAEQHQASVKRASLTLYGVCSICRAKHKTITE